MATKIRLQRKGRKRNAIYHIVATDSRTSRTGKEIERVGLYNPNTHPATVNLNFDRALYWVKVGAEMSDTAKNILSDEGVLLRNHLDGGVKKGAFDQAAADVKFAAWIQEKENKLVSKSQDKESKAEAAKKARFANETKVKDARAAAIVIKNSPVAEVVEEVVVEEEVAEVATEEVASEGIAGEEGVEAQTADDQTEAAAE